MTSWGLSGSGSRYHVMGKLDNRYALCKSDLFLWDRNLTPVEGMKCKKCIKLLEEVHE